MSGMRFDTNQSMKLGQQMKLAPKMIQSMEILQMGLPALQERIDQELESNVALEVVEPGLDLEGAESGTVQEEIERERREEQRTDSEGERELVVGQGDDALDFERLDQGYLGRFSNAHFVIFIIINIGISMSLLVAIIADPF